MVLEYSSHTVIKVKKFAFVTMPMNQAKKNYSQLENRGLDINFVGNKCHKLGF